MASGPASGISTSSPSLKGAEAASLTLGLPNVAATDSVAFPALPTEQRLTPEEKRALFDKISSRIKELEPDFTYLHILDSVFAETMRQIVDPKPFLDAKAASGRNIELMVGADGGTLMQRQTSLAAEINSLWVNRRPKIIAELINGKTIPEIQKGNPLIDRAAKKYGLDFSDRCESSIDGNLLGLVKYYETTRNYAMVEATALGALRPEIDKEVGKLTADEIDEIKRKVYARSKSTAADKPCPVSPDDELNKEVEAEKRKLALSKLSTLSPAKQEIWKTYEDVIDPLGRMGNVKSEYLDPIKDFFKFDGLILAISSLGGFIAKVNAARIVQNLLGRAVAEKVEVEVAEKVAQAALGEVAEQGAVAVTRTLAAGEAGEVAVAKKVAQSVWGDVAKKATVAASGALAAGAAFTSVHSVLHGQWIGDLPDWGQRVLWNSAALGFLGAGQRLGGALFKSEVLSPLVREIAHPLVKKAAEELVAKGFCEAAGLLTLRAAQEGYYNGNIDKLLDNFSDEALLAYATVLGIKAWTVPIGKLGDAGMRVTEWKLPKLGPYTEGDLGEICNNFRDYPMLLRPVVGEEMVRWLHDLDGQLDEAVDPHTTNTRTTRPSEIDSALRRYGVAVRNAYYIANKRQVDDSVHSAALRGRFVERMKNALSEDGRPYFEWFLDGIPVVQRNLWVAAIRDNGGKVPEAFDRSGEATFEAGKEIPFVTAKTTPVVDVEAFASRWDYSGEPVVLSTKELQDIAGIFSNPELRAQVSEEVLARVRRGVQALLNDDANTQLQFVLNSLGRDAAPWQITDGILDFNNALDVARGFLELPEPSQRNDLRNELVRRYLDSEHSDGEPFFRWFLSGITTGEAKGWARRIIEIAGVDSVPDTGSIQLRDFINSRHLAEALKPLRPNLAPSADTSEPAPNADTPNPDSRAATFDPDPNAVNQALRDYAAQHESSPVSSDGWRAATEEELRAAFVWSKLGERRAIEATATETGTAEPTKVKEAKPKTERYYDWFLRNLNEGEREGWKRIIDSIASKSKH